HDAAVGVEVKDAEVEQRRGDDADVDEVDPRRHQPLAQRLVQPRRRDAAVAAERDLLAARAPQVGADRLAEIVGETVVEIVVGVAANVVLTKDASVHRNSLRFVVSKAFTTSRTFCACDLGMTSTASSVATITRSSTPTAAMTRLPEPYKMLPRASTVTVFSAA